MLVSKAAARKKGLEAFAKKNRAWLGIPVSNSTQETLIIREVLVSQPKLKGIDGGLISSVPAFARARPGQTVEVPLEFFFDPSQASGVYEGRLSCAGVVDVPFVLHIPERTAVRFDPNHFDGRAKPGGTITRKTKITNTGNTPVKPNPIWTLMLSQSNEVTQILESFLGPAAEPKRDDLSKYQLQRLEQAMAHPTKLKFKPECPTLGPGESRQVQLVFLLPDNLEPNRTYHGRIPILNSHLGLTIFCVERR